MVNKLEIAWTLITVALIAGVAAYSTILVYHIDALPAHADEYVNVVGHQWFWQFCYPSNGTCFNVTYTPPPAGTSNSLGSESGGAMWVSPGSVVQINVTATDVVHSFNIPALGVRLDAIPGRTNSIAFTIPQVAAGTVYIIQCTEFCGTFHGSMRAFLVVT
jgi:cytochrome c oxidase subunit 2